MKISVEKSKTLQIVLAACMILVLALGGTFMGVEISKGKGFHAAGAENNPIQIDIATVTEGGFGFTFASNVLTITENGWYAITGTTTARRIVVASGYTVYLTFTDLNIENATSPALDITGATARITIHGTNVLTGACGIKVPSGALLVFMAASTGSITCTGVSGAGIGLSAAGTAGQVNVWGGTIVANGGANSAGIGGGGSGAGGIKSHGGTVAIGGGVVVANGSGNGAGIGGGSGDNSNGGYVGVQGGTVYARGYTGIGRAAGAGTNGTLVITGGNVAYSGTVGGRGAVPTNGVVGNPTTLYLASIALVEPPIYYTPITSAVINGKECIMDNYPTALETENGYYGMYDTITMSNGYLYLWLPLGLKEIEITASYNGSDWKFTGTINVTADNLAYVGLEIMPKPEIVIDDETSGENVTIVAPEVVEVDGSAIVHIIAEDGYWVSGVNVGSDAIDIALDSAKAIEFAGDGYSAKAYYTGASKQYVVLELTDVTTDLVGDKAISAITMAVGSGGGEDPEDPNPSTKYTLNFNSKGGSLVPSQTDLAEGASAVYPPAPTYAGYIFKGWYTDFNCTEGNEYQFGPMASETKTITVYAKWEPDGSGGGISGGNGTDWTRVALIGLGAVVVALGLGLVLVLVRKKTVAKT